jgi:predicted amidohydrolase
MNEHQFLTSGETLHMRNFSWGLCAQAICYDLRFPEIFRSYALNRARIILLPAEWPLKRISHWRTLIRARAIENQVFIAAVNCVGNIGEEIFGGCSAIISPWGDVVCEGNQTDEALLTSTINLDEVEVIRNKIPVFLDRRPDIYNITPIIE